MFSLYSRVLHVPSGKPCIILDAFNEGSEAPYYLLEVEEQDDPDPEWLYWAEIGDLEPLPEED